MLVKFNSTRILSFQHLTIVPGVQEISDAMVAAMQHCKSTKLKFESGELEIVDGTQGLDAIGAFLLMDAPKIKRIIKGTNDLRLLSNWLARETRESVKTLVQERIDVLSVVTYRDGSKGTLKLPDPEPLDEAGKAEAVDDDIFGESEATAVKKPVAKKPAAKSRSK